MTVYPALLKQTTHVLRKGDISVADYIDTVCDRIDAVDPAIQALLPEPQRRDRLHAEAAALAGLWPDPSARPPLYGIPVAVKDIFHVSGFETKAGSRVPAEMLAGPEAICVGLLKRAGALILGKSVTTEFAYFNPGPTRNPHNLAHTPGGSSSGSAAAVAAGLCPLAVGTQTIGSVIRPGAFCGVVGFKPTLDRIPTEGLLYFSRTADHVGLFTQDVSGMALAAEVLCREWRTIPTPKRLPVLGVPEGPYLKQALFGGLAAFEAELARLEVMGISVKRIPYFSDIQQINQDHQRLVSAEFAREHADLYRAYGRLYGTQTARIIEAGQKVTNADLDKLRRNGSRLRARIVDAMDTEAIDLWVSPSATGAAPEGIESTGDPIMNLPWTHAGMPAVSLPAGREKNGLPFGLQFIGRFNEDETLLHWCEWIGEGKE